MKEIAVLVPCYNEERTIRKVVSDFREQLPEADIYVYDNNSTDKTIEEAERAGAIIRHEFRQGKGFVVQKMFREIVAHHYVLVDGDDTYPADKVRDLLSVAKKYDADMVVGDRLSNGTYEQENKRSFHGFGNSLVRSLVNIFFRSELNDIMSGYRIFSYQFVKNYPILVGGFQLETDMSIFALDKKFLIKEVPIVYRDRPLGSDSKLNTYKDGFRVIMVIFNLIRYYRPFFYFTTVAIILLCIGFLIGVPVISEYVQTSYITKVPSAILASGVMVLSVLSFVCGVVLDAIKRSSDEHFEVHIKSED